MSGVDVSTRVFVVGVPRSGTTLVQSLLASHSAITSFTESHLFSRHFRQTPIVPMTILAADPRPRLLEFLSENGVGMTDAGRLSSEAGLGIPGNSLVRVLRTRRVARQLLGVLDRLALQRRRQVWVEKTARHLHYVPFLERVAGRGHVHFVHVIRDGLDVVASLHSASRQWPSAPHPFARGPSPPYDIETCARRWNHDMALSLARVSSTSDHFVLYEDLTLDPEATLAPVVASLGLPWEAAMLDRHAVVSPGLIAPGESWKRIAADLQRSSTVDQVFTDRQRAQAERALQSTLYQSIRDAVHRRPAVEVQGS